MRTAAVALGFAVAVSAAAGCTGSSAAPVTKDPIATMEPSVVTPSPTPTRLLGERTVAGAERFVRAYLAESNRAYATGDVAGLEASSAKECVTCKRIISSIMRTYSAGGSVQGGELAVSGVQSFSATVVSPMRVNAIASSSAGSFLNVDGSLRQRVKAEPKESFILTLRWTGEGWRVVAMEKLAKL